MSGKGFFWMKFSRKLLVREHGENTPSSSVVRNKKGIHQQKFNFLDLENQPP